MRRKYGAWPYKDLEGEICLKRVCLYEAIIWFTTLKKLKLDALSKVFYMPNSRVLAQLKVRLLKSLSAM